MATLNPLEQKARSSFIKGFVIALLIGILVSGFLGMQLYKKIGEEKQRLNAQKKVVVIKQNVVSGQLLTEDMFTTKMVDPDIAQTGAVDAYNKLSAYFLSDINGNRIDTQIDKNNNKKMIITIAAEENQANKGQYEVLTDENGSYYYKTASGETKYIQLANTALVAKIDLNKNTVMSADMIEESNEKTTDDLREQEYNMLTLPTDLKDNDVIDIRLRIPTGEDYIVQSKKRVKLLGTGNGGDASTYANTISIKQSEGDILTMSAAIVDAYRMKGCKFYATKYTDPGLQNQAQLTYIPSTETEYLIQRDPNIVEKAKAALIQYFNNNADNAIRGRIVNSINKENEENQKSAVESGTSAEISEQQSERKQYLQALTDAKQ